MNAGNIELFKAIAHLDQLLVFFGSQDFGMTLGDEGMVFFPGLCTKADVNLLQQVGFCRLGGWKFRLEAFLQGVEDLAIGFNALSRCFSADLVFEFGREVEGDGGHGYLGSNIYSSF